MRKCGYCGKTGHNRRTCPKLKADKEAELEAEVVVEAPKPKKKVQRCRACGEKDDHTAKNCPYKPTPEEFRLAQRDWSVGVSLGGFAMESVSDALV